MEKNCSNYLLFKKSNLIRAIKAKHEIYTERMNNLINRSQISRLKFPASGKAKIIL
jgi:hypothetical protein